MATANKPPVAGWARSSLNTLLRNPGLWLRLAPALALYTLTVVALAIVPSASAPDGLHWAEAAYHAFRFFALDGDPFFPRSPHAWENALMWFVLFADPALAATALFEALLVVRRALMNPAARVAASDGFVLVCGYGTHGRLIAEHAVAAGHEVVVLDRDLQDTESVTVGGHDLPVIVGDMTSAGALRTAGADRATMVWFAAGDPLTNLKAAVVAREQVPPVRPGTRDLIPMIDDDVAEDLLLDCVGRRGIVEFRQFDGAARHLAERRQVRAAVDHAHATGGRVAIVGFGRFGRAVLRALVQDVESRKVEGVGLVVELVDPHAPARVPFVRDTAAALGWRLEASAIPDGELWTATASDDPPALVFFCTDNDSLNLRCASLLHTRACRTSGASVEVVLRMTNPLREGEQQLAGVTMHSVAALLAEEVERTLRAAR
ncbi:MAG: NAD-binding protein [Myxococcales bacterium]|nr:NAD-binding protein [Myxococcales bacterium]MCB9533511.1 NAD-binding protein [Myxococcales bacterium]